MSNWFVLYGPTAIVYKDAETGEYRWPHTVAKHLNAIVQEGLTPLCVVNNSLGNGLFAIFTDSKWYFEADYDEMRRFEVPSELGDSVPVKAHCSKRSHVVVLELSDGRCLSVTMKADVEEDKWIESVTEIPRYGSAILGFIGQYCVSESDTGIIISKRDSPEPPRYIEADYQAIYVQGAIYLVNDNQVVQLTHKGNKRANIPLPDHIVPTAFVISASDRVLMLCGNSVYLRGPSRFVWVYDLPAKVLECRDHLVLCDDGLIYDVYAYKFAKMTAKPCCVAPSSRKSAF